MPDRWRPPPSPPRVHTRSRISKGRPVVAPPVRAALATDRTSDRMSDRDRDRLSDRMSDRVADRHRQDRDHSRGAERPPTKPDPPRSLPIVVPWLACATSARTCSPEELEYLSTLPEPRRAEFMRLLKAGADTRVPLRMRVLESNAPNKHEMLRRLRDSHVDPKLLQYCESVLRLPLGRGAERERPADMPAFLGRARAVMDEEIYGQNAVKDETIRALCSWALRPAAAASPMVIGLVGPPGVGKTSYAKAMGRILQRPTHFVSLGGMNDISVLLGHSFAYASSTYGQMAACLMECGCDDPVIVFDEVDKLSGDARAQEILAFLIHLTDPCSNGAIRDRYLMLDDVTLDFSRATLIFTMNDTASVSPVLLDRLTMVRMAAPSLQEKQVIASKFLVPRELSRLGVSDALTFDREAVNVLVTMHAREPGVRGLNRSIRRVVETLAVTNAGGADMLRTVHVSGPSTQVTCALAKKIVGHEAAPCELTMYA